MKLLSNTTHINGFDEYNIIPVQDDIFDMTYGYYLPYGFVRECGNYIFTDNIPYKVSHSKYQSGYRSYDVSFSPELYKDHKELLDTAKKVYTHPSCKISRSMMGAKYKKCLNPWLADIVVVPEFDSEEFYVQKVALFMNEAAKIIVKVNISDDFDKFNIQLKDGVKLGSLIDSSKLERNSRIDFSTQDLVDSEFFYFGEILYVPNKYGYVMDILTGSFPVDKIVLEDSVQASLGTEVNQITLENLINVKEMLDSSDENTVSAGLKAISMMDWMHYPNSLKYILNLADFRWKWNKATDSTSVKFMLNKLADKSSRNRWPGSYSDTIYEKDYQLFLECKKYFEHVEDDKMLEAIRFYDFMHVSSDGILQPNLEISA
jgi:hypothetical protein